MSFLANTSCLELDMNISEPCVKDQLNCSRDSNHTWSGSEVKGGEAIMALTNGAKIGVTSLLMSVVTMSVSAGLLLQLYRHFELHTSVNKLMASLASCAFLMGLLALAYVWPYQIIYQSRHCLLFSCVYCATFIVTLLHFMTISVERYVHIVHPFWHLRLTNNNRLIALCIFLIWTISFLLAFSPFYVELKPGWHRVCLHMMFIIPFWLFCLTYAGVFIVATTTVAVVYFKIFLLAHRHVVAIEQRRQILEHNTLAAVSHSSETSVTNLPHHSTTNGSDQAQRDSVDTVNVAASGSHDHTTNGSDQAQSDSIHTVNVPMSGSHNHTTNGSDQAQSDSIHTVNVPMSGSHDHTTNDSDPAQSDSIHTVNFAVSGSHDYRTNQNTLLQRTAAKKQASKLRSALPFIILYTYYFMSWAPNTVVKTYTSYTNQIFQPRQLDEATNVITLFSPIGYCLLFMYLEKDVRRVTLDKLCCCVQKTRVSIDLTSRLQTDNRYSISQQSRGPV